VLEGARIMVGGPKMAIFSNLKGEVRKIVNELIAKN
jgi:hypothetical protein